MKKLLVALGLLAVASPVGYAAYRHSLAQNSGSPCSCCETCVCDDCVCEIAGCTCETGGDCACTGDCCVTGTCCDSGDCCVAGAACCQSK